MHKMIKLKGKILQVIDRIDRDHVKYHINYGVDDNDGKKPMRPRILSFDHKIGPGYVEQNAHTTNLAFDGKYIGIHISYSFR